MPRKYTRKPDATPRGEWSQENLIKALKAIEHGKLSMREISQRFGIPPRTLKRRYAKKDYKKNSLGRHPTLDFDNEAYLATIIQKMQEEGITFTRRIIRRTAFEFAELLGLDVPFNKEIRMAGACWMLSFLERHPEISPVKERGKGDNIEMLFNDGILESLKEKVKEYNESKKLELQQKEEQVVTNTQDNSNGDPLMIKIERTEDLSDDGSIGREDTEFTVEYSSSLDDIKTKDTEECSSSNNIAKKRKIDSSNDECSNSNIEELVEVKCDGIDLLFLGYASTLKKMSRRKQITVKHEIANIFMEAELSELE